jgi:hypothetical protein
VRQQSLERLSGYLEVVEAHLVREIAARTGGGDRQLVCPPGLLMREGTRWLERPASWRGSSSQRIMYPSLTTAVQCHAVLCGAVLCCVVRAMLVPSRTAAEGK